MAKFVSVCVVIFASCILKYDAAITDTQKSKIHIELLRSGLECLGDYPLSFEHIKTFTERKMPESEDAKCFVKCIYMHLGVMDDNGKLNEKKAKDSAKKIFEEGDELLPKIDEMITECMKVNDEEISDNEKGCDRAALVFECFLKKAPKLGLDVDL